MVHVFSHEPNEGLDLVGGDVLVEEFLVVVQERSDRVLRQNIVANLLLHETKLLGNVFLKGQKKLQLGQKDKELQERAILIAVVEVRGASFTKRRTRDTIATS